MKTFPLRILSMKFSSKKVSTENEVHESLNMGVFPYTNKYDL